MTNLEAYIAYNPDENIGLLSLGAYSIDPELITDLQVSSAIGMIDKAMSSDYSQSGTTEKIPASVREYLMARGKSILALNGLAYIEPKVGNIIKGGSY